MAAKAMVKCLYCGKMLDRNSEPCAKPKGNRYAHQKCYDKHMASMSQEERDYEELIEYIKHLLGEDLNPRVWKQLKEYKDVYKYSYSGILKTLKWWYDLKGNSVEKANGAIGIVPYVYQQACQYYYALYLAAVANEDKDVEHYKVTVREFSIEPPARIIKPPRLFKFEEDEDNE